MVETSETLIISYECAALDFFVIWFLNEPTKLLFESACGDRAENKNVLIHRFHLSHLIQ